MSSVASLRRELTFAGFPPDFRRAWTAMASSNLADGIVRVAIAVIAVDLTTEPLLVAAVAIAGALPSVLVVLFAGAFADRFDRKRILFVAEVTRIGTLVIVMALAAVDGLGLPVLMVAAFVLGIQQTFWDATAVTLVPLIVEPRAIRARTPGSSPRRSSRRCSSVRRSVDSWSRRARSSHSRARSSAMSSPSSGCC